MLSSQVVILSADIVKNGKLCWRAVTEVKIPSRLPLSATLQFSKYFFPVCICNQYSPASLAYLVWPEFRPVLCKLWHVRMKPDLFI